MSSDPWQILILDANTATEKDVKAAYARMLKQHRPDSDPEGFRRVREAYEIALATIRMRAPEGTPAPACSQDTGQTPGEGEGTASAPEAAYTPPVVELPEAVRPSVEEMERAVSSGNPGQLVAAIEAFHAQCEAAGVDALNRVMALERVCAGDPKILAAAIPIPILLRLAELGQVNLPHLVISVWLEANGRERIVQFGRAMLDQGTRFATPDGAVLMGRVGFLVGLERPGLSSALGNLCYPHLPVDVRAQIMGQLEHETALGKAFEDVNPAMKPFWFERMRSSGEPYNWNSQEFLRAIDDLVHRNRYQWQGWGIISQLLPPERWAQVEGRLQNQAQQAAQSESQGSRIPGWIIIPIVIFAANFLRFLGSDSTSSAARDSRVLEQMRLQQQELERDPKYREAMRKYALKWNHQDGKTEVPPSGKVWVPPQSPTWQPRILPSNPPRSQPGTSIPPPGTKQPVTPGNSTSRQLLQNPMSGQQPYWTPPPPPSR